MRNFHLRDVGKFAAFRMTKLSAHCTAMPRETVIARVARTRKILAGLQVAYPDAHCELNFDNPLQLLIATILSAQCTDKRVNLVTAELFKRYRSAQDFAAADLTALEQAVKTTGFFRNKAKNIQACCRALVDKHGGEVPHTMDELTALAGVGRKTANVVLGNAFDINVGIVVDTHVTRLANRLGLTRQSDARKDRAGINAAGAPRAMDAFQSLAHLAWPAPLRSAEAGLRGLRDCEAMSAALVYRSSRREEALTCLRKMRLLTSSPIHRAQSNRR